jgi:endonuclease-3
MGIEGKPDWDKIIGVLKRLLSKEEDPSVTRVRRRREGAFPVLVATLISLRTKDKVTILAAERLLETADTPERILELPAEKIEKLIYPAGFYKTKAKNLKAICGILIARYGGKVPSDEPALLELPGVGRKTAALVRSEGFGIPDICVDTHVHRVANRMGWLSTREPDETQAVLKELVPKGHWIEINPLLVSFGKAICVPISPKCSSCPFSPACPKAGVARSR